MPPSSEAGAPFRWFFLAAFIGVVLAACCVWLVWHPQPEVVSQPPTVKAKPEISDEVVEACRLLADSLKKWHFESPMEAKTSREADEICRRYFGVLAQDQFIPDRLLSDLPENAFVNRLPPKPFGHDLHLSDSTDDLRKELERLAVHLGANPNTMTLLGIQELLGNIRYQMDYRKWLENDGDRRYIGRPSSLDPAVRRYIDHFRDPAAAPKGDD